MEPTGLRTFFREVHVDDPRLAARRFLTTNLRLRCPACEGARIAKGPFGVIARCPVCGSRFDRMEGNELVSIPLAFVLTLGLLTALSLVLVLRYGFFAGLRPLLAGVGSALVLLLLRPMRVLTLWLLWLAGFVYPDRLTEKGRQLLPAREEDDPVTYELAARAPRHGAGGD